MSPGGKTAPHREVSVPREPAAAVFDRNWICRRLIHHRFGCSPDAHDLSSLARVCDRRPDWVLADALPADLLFIHDVIRCVRPRRVVEIGVASGVSTAVILHSLSANGAPLMDPSGLPCVESLDILENVPWEPPRPIGAAIAEMVPDLVKGSRIHTRRTSLDLGAIFTPRSMDFAFLDANHSHPWPALDAIELAGVLRPGSWIVLHDIALVERALVEARRLNLHEVDWDARGAEYLFEFWPWEKIRGIGGTSNLGAVRLPALAPFRAGALRDLIALPWETGLPIEAINRLKSRVGDAPVWIGANMHRAEVPLPPRPEPGAVPRPPAGMPGRAGPG